ncbi:MAG: ADP-ribosylglycohydrolase family protein [Clostridia bacterium]|nr:ADP-ribosylglycohydrolase family protein [Clostridia bacterium]
MMGAICGDILGSTYEFEKVKYEDISEIRLMNDTDEFTDDTALTLAVAEWLLYDIDKSCDDEELKLMLAKRFVTYALDKFDPSQLGFGARFWRWCCDAKILHEYAPIHSYGNGAGMRVSPVGWFFDTLEETLRFAKLTADVTHNHPEGEKGAMCIAAAIFLARTGKSKQEIKEYLLEEFAYPLLNETYETLRKECVWSEICQDTVPMSVVAFLESDNYESAVLNAIAYGSDSDTIADMAGAIAEAYYGGVPEELLNFCRGRLNEETLILCDEFKKRIKA